MSWPTSNRRETLPDDWAQRVAQVKRRADNRCEATHHAPGCNRRGTDVDHITPYAKGGTDELSNLQLLSGPCHDRKTRIDNGYQAAIKAPAERHPGRR